jgi:hypothetical protein
MRNEQFTTGQIRPIECVKEAWELIKDEYWTLFAISIVGAMLAGISLYVLIGPMVCGILGCYLKKIDGGPVKFDDLWIGFKYFWPSLLVTIVVVVPIIVYLVAAMSTIYLPIIMKAVGGSRVSDDELLAAIGVALVVDLIVAVIMVCLHSLVIFSFPLIVDRGISSWPAIKLSARAALKNIGGVAGIIGVNFVLGIAGYLAFCVGLYLVIPLITATNIVAYRKVFPRQSLA